MRGERLHGADKLVCNGNIATLIAGYCTAFAAIEVALAAFTLQELAALGFDNALSDGFCSFNLHKLGWV